MRVKKPRIFVAYTGGTVGMEKLENGYRPTSKHLGRLMTENPRFNAHEMPTFDIQELEPLLDSADMTPKQWYRIAREIEEHYDDYDGFLVIHGTDTMAYTASALSFMLENLSKPVILTGSQIPLSEVRNDAFDNLLGALMILGDFGHRLSEVFIYFDNKLYRGNRATKVDSDSFAAFDSPNFPPVANVGININIDFRLIDKLRRGKKPLSVVALGDATVAVLRLFPGIKAEYLTHMLAPPVEGVVLECFGSGNAPARNRELLRAIDSATKRGVIITAVCQPVRGTADLNLYETGRALRDVGVVSGFDMTTEAALAKLFYLFAKGLPPKKVAALAVQNLKGELTPPGKGAAQLEETRRRLTAFQRTDIDD